jgi:hypothetical protein
VEMQGEGQLLEQSSRWVSLDEHWWVNHRERRQSEHIL